MVLKTAQTTAFFEDNEEMGIPHSMVVQLQRKGIMTIGDLEDFEKDSLLQLVDKLHCPIERI